MAAPARTTDIQSTFAKPADAEVATAALREAGVPHAIVEVKHSVLPEERQREARFLWRVLVIIVLWSIVGGVIGAGFGWLLAEMIGPEGTAGLVLQLVSWIIVGHLIAGMLAGYFVLADRTQREMPPDRPVSVVTVRGLDPGRSGAFGGFFVHMTRSKFASSTQTGLPAHPEALVG